MEEIQCLAQKNFAEQIIMQIKIFFAISIFLPGVVLMKIKELSDLFKPKLLAGLRALIDVCHKNKARIILVATLFILVILAGLYLFGFEHFLNIKSSTTDNKNIDGKPGSTTSEARTFKPAVSEIFEIVQSADSVPKNEGSKDTVSEDKVTERVGLIEHDGTIYVPADYPKIQEAIDHAQNGDTIIVEPGLYQENIIIEAKNITIKSKNPEDPDIVAATVIDAGGEGPVISLSNIPPDTFILKGLTITGGRNEANGGGIIIKDASPTIVLNQIVDNQSMGYGGGIYIYGWSLPNIMSNQILKNSSELGGGGIAVMDCLPVIINNNHFEGNSTSFGGAVYIGEYCSVDLGDPDLNSYINNGSRYIFERTASFPKSGIEMKNLYNYKEIIEILGEPQEIKNYVEGEISYDLELYYEDFHYLSSSFDITIKAFSDRFIGPYGLRVGDSAAKVINRYGYDEINFHRDSGRILLFDEEHIYYELGVSVYYGHLYFENGDVTRIDYTSFVAAMNGCGAGSTDTYIIEDGIIICIEKTSN